MDLVPLPDTCWQPPSVDGGAIAALKPRPHTLLTLEQWLALRERWPQLPTGVCVPNTADVSTLAADLPRLTLVELQFPKWTDGRAYSQARLLRTRHRFGGELRAAGDVVVDMLPLLHRTGFSSAQLRTGQCTESARRALRFFDGHYQGDAVEPRPLFHREAVPA